MAQEGDVVFQLDIGPPAATAAASTTTAAEPAAEAPTESAAKPRADDKPWIVVARIVAGIVAAVRYVVSIDS